MDKFKSEKYLAWCFHGFTVIYSPGRFVSGLNTALCNHPSYGMKEIKTIEEVIEKVESVRQPRWVKTIKIGKFQFNLIKYW